MVGPRRGVLGDRGRRAPDNPDLGTRSLFELAVLRLTEVEVHGTDLDIGLPDWSDEFVRVALPMRMERLRTRPIRDPLTACWQFDVDDGPSYSVAVEGSSVNVRAGQGEPNLGRRVEHLES